MTTEKILRCSNCPWIGFWCLEHWTYVKSNLYARVHIESVISTTNVSHTKKNCSQIYVHQSKLFNQTTVLYNGIISILSCQNWINDLTHNGDFASPSMCVLSLQIKEVSTEHKVGSPQTEKSRHLTYMWQLYEPEFFYSHIKKENKETMYSKKKFSPQYWNICKFLR